MTAVIPRYDSNDIMNLHPLSLLQLTACAILLLQGTRSI